MLGRFARAVSDASSHRGFFMSIVVRDNKGVDLTVHEKRLQELLQEYKGNQTPEIRAELVQLYETISRYKPGCAICRNGRKNFMDSLGDLANGDLAGAKAKLMGALRSVRLKRDVSL